MEKECDKYRGNFCKDVFSNETCENKYLTEQLFKDSFF